MEKQFHPLDEAKRQPMPLACLPRGDRDSLPSDSDLDQIEVTVIGGGLAGLAASIHLVRAGLRVLCIKDQIADAQPVGESLDWSAPELLADLGLPMQRLIGEGLATWKRRHSAPRRRVSDPLRSRRMARKTAFQY